ncbi:thymidylate kinase [Candidatus Woesearchaeota archaeon]|nr:thymidylate kinase [Candidatus Woesearchaeota archaeon]
MVFVVIDGIDGTGKGTQSLMLMKRLIAEGYSVKLMDFPRHSNPSAYFVDAYLNGEFSDKAEDVHPKTASLFYALDRFAAKKEMVSHLSSGGIIISNRYVSSNKGHQLGKIKDSTGRDEFLYWLDDLEYGILGLPREDVNILLNASPKVSQINVDKKSTRSYTSKKRDLHEFDLEHLASAREAYSYVAQKENWHVIDCAPKHVMRPVEDIHEEIYSIVKPLI